MTQNSLSPVVKSRISSSSGRTMRVENRSLARTGKRNDPKRSAQHQRGGEGDSKPGQSEVERRYESRKKCEDKERSGKTGDDENPEDEPNHKHSHGFAPASTSSPFSNP